jgi:hypothetical protein
MKSNKCKCKSIILFLTETGLFLSSVGIFQSLVTPKIASALSRSQSRFNEGAS